jgi:hypothetical protein
LFSSKIIEEEKENANDDFQMKILQNLVFEKIEKDIY